ncbi:MAG: helix-hairpin-helix domain-containing protein [Bacteroidales bacterium]|nr:helix-hairpin-helix domain-containing protein [Bacteroidales bacterium]
MKKNFFIPRGEFIAITLLLLLITAIFTFTYFYRKIPHPTEDLSAFKEQIEQFYVQQHAMDDSVRAARDSLRQTRTYHNGKRQNRSSWTSSGAGEYPHEHSSKKDSLKPFNKTPQYDIVKVDLNHCDTSDIVRIPQFGSKRAQKIIEYRERLGGFHSLSQLREIYILQNIDLDYCKKYFTVRQDKIKKIKINTASYKEMIKHPYFDAYLVKSILNYREKQGKINNISEFRQITHVYQELLDKLEPYLCFD